MATTEETSNNQSLNNQTSTVANGDSVNPFYLSSSDNNTIQLVSQKLIGGRNYFPWARSMIITLISRHKTSFVDGTIAKPSPDSPQFILWTWCNMTVLSWIINSVSPNIVSSIMYTNNARTICLIFAIGSLRKVALELLSFRRNQLILFKGNCLWRIITQSLRLWLMNWLTTRLCLCVNVPAIVELKELPQIFMIMTK